MKEYIIKYEPVEINGKQYAKYNVYYFKDNVFYNKEFHSTDGISGEVRPGYSENKNLITNK